MSKKLVIAIDGFSSCGKSTVAKDLAKRLGYIYVDSGAMYRAVTLFCMNEGLIENGIVDEESLKLRLDEIEITFKLNEVTNVPVTYLNGKHVENDIRTMEVSNNVSPVCMIGFVRARLVDLQQAMGAAGGIVMDGRDIGTVVFPKADLKIFMTADPVVRAKRRYDELVAKGDTVSLEEVVANIEKRDHLDQTRDESPLVQADDAIVLDNTYLTKEEQLDWIVAKVNSISE